MNEEARKNMSEKKFGINRSHTLARPSARIDTQPLRLQRARLAARGTELEVVLKAPL